MCWSCLKLCSMLLRCWRGELCAALYAGSREGRPLSAGAAGGCALCAGCRGERALRAACAVGTDVT